MQLRWFEGSMGVQDCGAGNVFRKTDLLKAHGAICSSRFLSRFWSTFRVRTGQRRTWSGLWSDSLDHSWGMLVSSWLDRLDVVVLPSTVAVRLIGPTAVTWCSLLLINRQSTSRQCNYLRWSAVRQWNNFLNIKILKRSTSWLGSFLSNHSVGFDLFTFCLENPTPLFFSHPLEYHAHGAYAYSPGTEFRRISTGLGRQGGVHRHGSCRLDPQLLL